MISMTTRGTAYPLGATLVDGGVNFSVFANKAEVIELLLFDHADDVSPTHMLHFDPALAEIAPQVAAQAEQGRRVLAQSR